MTMITFIINIFGIAFCSGLCLCSALHRYWQSTIICGAMALVNVALAISTAHGMGLL